MNTKKAFKISSAIALILLMAIAIPFYILPVEAHDPPWRIPTFAYVHPAPDPVGVGQDMTFVFWLTLVMPGSYVQNDVRFEGFTLTITDPDGQETKLGPYTADTTSSMFASYTPEKVGNYTVSLDFPGQTFRWGEGTPQIGAATQYQNDYFLPSNDTRTFTVQQDPVKTTFVYPLPTEYWTRPIEGQNDPWYQVASNWLSGPSCVAPAGVQDDYYQKDGIAPNSAHIMWTKPIEDGGVVGGTNTGFDGNVFYSGTQYNPRVDNPIIMNGRLYYELPYGNSGSGGGLMAVDLQTGETAWYLNRSREGLGEIAFGYLYAYEHYNQHGVVPEGWLFTSNFGRAVQPSTGRTSSLGLTGVPSGTTILGPSGEHLRYSITNAGTTSNPNWRLTQWNSSRVFIAQNSGTINASLPSAYDWNVSIDARLISPSIQAVMFDDVLLGRNGTLPSTLNQVTEITYWGISLKPENRGHLLWMKNIQAPPNNMTLMSESAAEGVFIMTYKETMQWLGYDMHTGNLLWGPTSSEPSEFGYFSWTTGGFNTNSIADGKFFSAGYSGHVYAYDLNNGSLLWDYEAKMESAIFSHQTLSILAIADNKMYLGTHEHSASTPLYKDVQVRCIELDGGTELWKMMGWGAAYSGAVADGYFTYLNLFDHQIYSVGKGPSSTTVAVNPKVTPYGTGVLIEGTVTDIAAGTKQEAQAARFPNGLPAVSDDSMGNWMEYVYMQKPKPDNTTGVLVKLYVIDANNNYRPIGETTSDDNGFFSYAWDPDIAGKYTVIAKFEGTESYWPSQAVSAFAVSESVPTQPPPQQAESIADMYFVPAIAGIIIAIAVVGVLLALLMLKKRP